MKRFAFPLDRIRSWRREQADLEELALRRLHAERHNIDKTRQSLEDEASVASLQLWESACPNPLDLANLDTFRSYIAGRLAQVARQRADCEKRISEQRQKLLEARRKFELLDRLKKKSLAEWEAGRLKEEEELAAELYLARRRRDPPDTGF